MADIIEIHHQGYNCAETMIKAFNEEDNLNIPVSIASPFGGGMAVGSTCGAITGALLALGALKGREEPTDQNEARLYAKEIMGKVKEKYGTYDCIELKKKGISCDEIIKYAHDILNETLNK